MREPGTEFQVDVRIHGAGPVGCALALALRESGLRIALQAAGSPRPGFRPIALSYASRLILERLGVWPRIAATAIETIHVSQQGGFGRVRLDAADAGVPALGYVTDYGALVSTLYAECEGHLTDTEMPARCVVHAEGASAGAQEKRYVQDAVVALVSTDPAASSIAFERFTPEGPLALLPFAGRYALVWSCRPERASSLAECPAEIFCRELRRAAGHRLGRTLHVEARAVQPLLLRVLATRVGKREVYIGNAAQTLHPVAGQGLNLGLRDAWDLSRILLESADPGDAATLARYVATRRLDARATVGLTDALAGAFLGSNRLMRAARGAALAALDVLPGPRRFFARRMIYGPSALP